MTDDTRPARKVVIVGCGRVGARLATRLVRQNYEVTVIDEVREAFLRLGSEFPGLTVQGSGMDAAVLRQAGAGPDATLLALTGGDNRNLTIAQMAKHLLNVNRCVARLHDPVRAELYRDFGIETLCTTTVLEGLLELYVCKGHFPDLPGEMSAAGDASELADS